MSISIRDLGMTVIRRHGPDRSPRAIEGMAREFRQEVPAGERREVFLALAAAYLKNLCREADAYSRPGPAGAPARDGGRLPSPAASPPPAGPVRRPPAPAPVPAAGRDVPAGAAPVCEQSGVPPVMCAHCTGRDGVPAEGRSAFQAIRERLDAGGTPADAVDEMLPVMDMDELLRRARSDAIREARKYENEVMRPLRMELLARGEQRNARRRRRLGLLIVKTPDGRRYPLGKAPRDVILEVQLFERAMQVRHRENADAYQVVLDFQDEHGVLTLDEVPGWEEQIGPRVAKLADRAGSEFEEAPEGEAA